MPRLCSPASMGLALVALMLAVTPSAAREHLTNERGQRSAFSPGVVTTGGKVVWLSGATAAELPADFDSQVRQAFAIHAATLARAGGKLSDIVTMTVFITDPRLGPRFTELRKAIFKDDFPASALITVSALARPEMLVEIQAVAVIETGR